MSLIVGAVNYSMEEVFPKEDRERKCERERDIRERELVTEKMSKKSRWKGNCMCQ